MHKHSYRIIIVCLTTIIVGGGVLPSLAEEDAPANLTDNLFIDGAVGMEKPVIEDSTAFGTVGFNWGIPLTRDPQAVALGLQLGGDVKFREDDPEYDLTLGGFGRNFRVFDGQQTAAAVLFDYRHTSFGNDLWSIRPILGTTVSARDSIGVTGVIGLNTDTHTDDGTRIRQEAIDRVQGFWTREWSDVLATEVSVGYQFSDVDEGLFGGQLAYGLTPYVDVVLGGEVNTDGNYAVGVSMSYHFGGTGRHASLHNIRGAGRGLHTPFPKRSLPAMMQRTTRTPSEAPPTPPTPPDSSSTSEPSDGGGDSGDNSGGTGSDTGTGSDDVPDTGADDSGSTGGETGGTGDDPAGDEDPGTGSDENPGSGDEPDGGSGDNPGSGDEPDGDPGDAGDDADGSDHWNRSGGDDGTNPGDHGNEGGQDNPGYDHSSHGQDSGNQGSASDRHANRSHGNNGLGNGIDPQPPGNPPANDDPDTVTVHLSR